jgi:hypothetical protein
VNVERLEHCASFLESKDCPSDIQGGMFNLGRWMNTCGTAGCAIGWYLTKSPEPTKNRFRLTDIDEFPTGEYSVCRHPTYTDEYGMHWASFDAVARYFGVPEWHAEYLFSAESYDDYWKPLAGGGGVGPDKVAARIRDYIRDKGLPR